MDNAIACAQAHNLASRHQLKEIGTGPRTRHGSPGMGTLGNQYQGPSALPVRGRATVTCATEARAGRFTTDGGSWANDVSWVHGYENVLAPLEHASTLFEHLLVPGQRTPLPARSVPLAGLRNELLPLLGPGHLDRLWGRRNRRADCGGAAANRFARAMTMPVVIRSQVFCRSMRPGSPMIRVASNPSRTTGSTHGGFTRYLAGSATCRPTMTMIPAQPATSAHHVHRPRPASPEAERPASRPMPHLILAPALRELGSCPPGHPLGCDSSGREFVTM
jgi:hypothetical protein